MKWITPLVCMVAASSAFGRLGETQDQAEARYGLAKKPMPPGIASPLVDGGRELTFEYQGWKIRCALLPAKDGREYIVREEYMKLGHPTISDFERDAVLEAEGSGKKWTEMRAGLSLNPIRSVQNQLTQMLTGRTWVREDGAVAVHGLGGFPIRLELPQAAKWDAQMKAIKEQKARAAVPKF